MGLLGKVKNALRRAEDAFNRAEDAFDRVEDRVNAKLQELHVRKQVFVHKAKDKAAEVQQKHTELEEAVEGMMDKGDQVVEKKTAKAKDYLLGDEPANDGDAEVDKAEGL